MAGQARSRRPGARHNHGGDVGINADQGPDDFMGRILRDQRVVQHEMVDPRGQEADDGIARRLHDRLFWLRRH